MAFQAVFQRYELKYLLTADQQEKILSAMAPYMQPDRYGRTTVRNLYYDTDDYLLIRRSIEKPIYKEKLRLRSYSRADSDTPVFVELKKKYKHVVYKRRLSLANRDAIAWLSGSAQNGDRSQIAEEIRYFLQFYAPLHPTVFLSYDRTAYRSADSSGLRITFDSNILCRQHSLSLEEEPSGTPILPEGRVLMELKCSGGIPLWLTRVLSAENIRKTSFSKYGTAYRTLIFPQTHPVNNYQMMEVPFYD